MMPEPMDADDMPDISDDYESPYPIDDRHLMDSIYRMTVTNHDAMDDMYGSFRVAKVIVGMLCTALVVIIFAGIVLTVLGGNDAEGVHTH